jgi:hypothetical protein
MYGPRNENRSFAESTENYAFGSISRPAGFAAK